MKCSFKARVKNPMCESSPVFVLKLVFLTHLFVCKKYAKTINPLYAGNKVLGNIKLKERRV